MNNVEINKQARLSQHFTLGELCKTSANTLDDTYILQSLPCKALKGRRQVDKKKGINESLCSFFSFLPVVKHKLLLILHVVRKKPNH
jgi:hypothetical protein